MENKAFFPLQWLLVVAVFMSACALVTSQTPAPPGSGSQPAADSREIGSVSREADRVELGKSAETLHPVIDPSPLQVGELLRVSQGGAARIKFTEKMQIVLFNDSQIGLYSASPPDTPRAYQLFLTRGGCYGELKEQGGIFELATPSGVKISVLGTRFFVVYDEQQNLTTVGNFDGLLGVTSTGGSEVIPPGTFVDVPTGQQPGPPIPIPVSVEQFDRWARDNDSSLIAVELMRAAPTLTPTATMTPAQNFSPTAALTQTLTVTDTLAVAPSLTRTPTSTETPMPTGTTIPPAVSTFTITPAFLGPPTALVTRTAGCRSGPGSVFDVVTQFVVGQSLSITGRLPDQTWWLVQIPGSQATCWIWESNVRVSGDLSSVKAIPAPTIPALTFTPTFTLTETTITPTPTGTPTPTETATPTDTPTQTDTPITPTYTNTAWVDSNPPQVNLTAASDSVCITNTLEVSAYVTDESGILSVILDWSTSTEKGSQTMTLVDPSSSGGKYTGAAGPVQKPDAMNITVEAMDKFNNLGTASTTVKVVDCFK